MASDPYIDCRPGNLRHAWDDMAVPLGLPPTVVGWFREWARCTRCTTIRRYEISLATGDVMSRSYEHPTDWVTYSGDDQPTANDFRLLRVKEKQKEDRRARSRAGAATNGASSNGHRETLSA